jgi:hypothetical protein
MVALKEALNQIYRVRTGKRLVYLSLARFDQQVSTKFHLDGAPLESYLMLGYEPTAVRSRVAIADYTRAAHDWGIEPQVLLTERNPMYADHERQLLPYATVLEAFDPAAAQILLINNSSLPYRPDGTNSLGVMHQATILNPMPGRSRVVNSTMIGTADESAVEALDPAAQKAFLETQAVAGEVMGSYSEPRPSSSRP